MSENRSRVTGVDVGTMFFQVSESGDNGSVKVKTIRNAFVELPDTEDVEEILSRNDWQWLKDGKHYYILGEDSLRVANMFPNKVDLRRPMQDGVLNKNEDKKMLVMAEIIKSSLGEAPDDKSVVCTCVSSESVDGSPDSTFHRSRLMGMFKRLGWNTKVIEEGHAIVLSERPVIVEKDEVDDDVEVPYSGVGCSFGAGRSNCVLAYKGLQVVGMSAARCLSKKFPVLCNGQIMSISEVQPGDIVIDGMGQESEVLSVIDNGYKEELLSIGLKRFSNIPLEMTEEHKVFIKRNLSWQWLRADEIVIGDILGVPVILPSVASSNMLYLGTDYNNNRIRLVKSRNLGRLFGLFLGDGSTNFNKNGHGYVQWAINRKDSEIIEKYDRILTELLDIDVEMADCPQEGLIRLKAHRTYLAKFFKQRFYNACGEKICPLKLSDIPDQMAIGIIEGLIDSDGFRPQNRYRYNGFAIYNTSTAIIMLAHMLFNRFSIQHSISKRDPRLGGINSKGIQIEGKKDAWSIQAYALAASLFQTFVNHENHGFSYQRPDFIEYKVESIKKVSYNDNVFDLKVNSPHHSFSSLGAIVHNCGDWIDQRVSDATGQPIGQVTRKKERHLDFDALDQDDDVIFALDAYYGEMIKYVFEHFGKKFATVKSQFDYPLTIVVAGGTSMPQGFCNKVREVLLGLDLPFEIKDVVHASDSRNAVVKGLLVQAAITKRRLDKGESIEK